jgi:hypothetical protein
MTLDHTVTITWEHTAATMILEHTVAFDTKLALVPLVALLTSLTVMRRKEHLWNFSVGLLQREHLSNLVNMV